MRKKAAKYLLPGLILLMSVALAGIILVQYFWIRNAVSVKEAMFDRAVNEALNNTVAQLKKDRDAQFVSDQVWVEDDDETESHSIIVSGKDPEAVEWSESNSASYVYSSSENNSRFSFEHFQDSNKRYRTIIKLDSLRNVLKENNILVLTEFQDTMEFIVRQKITEVRQQSAEMNEVIEDMVVELKSYDVSRDQVLDSTMIRNRLMNRFDDAGLDLKFDFFVTHGADNEAVLSFGEVPENPEISEDAYTIRIFPESLFGRDELLVVEFPEKEMHILKSMGWLMTGSGLFTAIILLTFFLALRIIIQQKKISAIKSDFINNMTHEFKTPIATISLALDSINNPSIINNPAKIQYFTGVIGEENKRMNANVENVLQMSLIDKKDFDFRIQKTNVEEVISGITKKFGLQLKKRQGSMNLEFNCEDPIISTDPDHLGNIISNLVDNALKYSEKSPEILISTKNTGNFIEITVSDKGIGMTREEQTKIFDKFYRVPRGDIHNIKGFGLGLSYVKAVVLAFGGTIYVSSQLSNGSSFKIRLPKA